MEMQTYTGPERRGTGFETCLIVEDSTFDQQRMTRIVNRSHRDIRVNIVSTLAEAREALKRERYSLILLDNNLPDGKGADFSIELSSDRGHSNTPVIMVSDWPSPFMWEKAAAAGVLYIVNKSEFGVRYIHAALKRRRKTDRRLN